MSFTEQYVRSLNTSDLRDDEHHHATLPLHAAALSDTEGGVILGSLLVRVKFASSAHKTFESGTADLAQLLKMWEREVVRRGQERKWVPANTAWDMEASIKIYQRIAHMSLAHWIDPRCEPCQGAGAMDTRRTCTACAGTGRAEIQAGRFETDLIKDAVSELEGVFQAHSWRATKMLRRAA